MEEGMTIPKSDGKFTKPEGEDKNYTKIVMDDEHNKAFITEFKEKLKKCNEADEAELKRGFLEMTGIDFDSIEINEDTNEITIPESAFARKEITVQETTSDTGDKILEIKTPDGEPGGIPEATVIHVDDETKKLVAEVKESGVIDENGTLTGGVNKTAGEKVKNLRDAVESFSTNFEDDSEIEYTEEVLNQVDKYMADPLALKFTVAEMEGMARIGIMDYNTISDLCSMINDELDMIASEMNYEDSPFFDEERRRKAILNTIAIKVDTEKLIKAGDEILDPEIISKIYNHKYPKLATRGTSFILDDFAGYIEDRIDSDKTFLVKELNSKKRIDNIFNNIQNYVFRYMKTEKGEPYKLSQFIMLIYTWNKRRLCALTGISEESVNIRNFDSILVIFSSLFLRFIYKQVVPDFKSKSIQKKLFFQFFTENAEPEKVPIEGYPEMLDESWNNVWKLCHTLVVDCLADYKAGRAARGQTSR